MASYIATSTNWPSPVRAACSRALTTPIVATAPANRSPTLGPHFTTVPSASPVMLTSPPIAWATTSYAGQRLDEVDDAQPRERSLCGGLVGRHKDSPRLRTVVLSS